MNIPPPIKPVSSSRLHDEIWSFLPHFFIALILLAFSVWIQIQNPFWSIILLIVLLCIYGRYLYNAFHSKIRQAFQAVEDVRQYNRINETMLKNNVQFQVTIIQHKYSQKIEWFVTNRIVENFSPSKCKNLDIASDGSQPLIDYSLQNIVEELPRILPFVLVFYNATSQIDTNTSQQKIYQKVQQIVKRNKGDYLYNYRIQQTLFGRKHTVCYSLCGWPGKWLKIGYYISAVTGFLWLYLILINWLLVDCYEIQIRKQVSFEGEQNVINNLEFSEQQSDSDLSKALKQRFNDGAKQNQNDLI